MRLEAAGTSRIEGAEFTPREEEEALAPYPPIPTSLTHSQRQLRAADTTYRWLRSLPSAQWVTTQFILDVHRRIVTGCDDDHDLTPFLRFALGAVTERCNAVAAAITANHERTLFREFARSLFGQLRSPRRRVLADRQLRILEVLLDGGSIGLDELVNKVRVDYGDLKFPVRALARDLVELIDLAAIVLDEERVAVNLAWPQQFSDSELLARYEGMPSAASSKNPAMATLSQLLGRRRGRSGR